MQSIHLSHAKSIAGTALLGCGAFILYRNLEGAVAQLRTFISAPSPLACYVYAADQRFFLQKLVLHLLILSWPMLLVTAGAALSKEPEKLRDTENKESAFVDEASRRSTSK